MSDRERFRQLNDLLTHGQALTELITPYANDEQFWPRNAAPPWPQAYAAWYTGCRTALDPDLWSLLAALDAGDRQRRGVCQVIERSQIGPLPQRTGSLRMIRRSGEASSIASIR